MASVKLQLAWLHDTEATTWARIAVPMAGPQRGTYLLPEVDDQVLVVFEHGDINRPIVIGALWSKKQPPVEVNASGKNNTKLIKSRCGHRVIFDDTDGAEKIVIVDKTGKNKIVLDSAAKVVKLESDGDIEVFARSNVIVHANALKIGTTEAISGKAASLLTHSQKTFGIKSSSITVGGGTTTINVSNAAATRVSGSGAGELGGAFEERPREPSQPGDRSADSRAGGSAAAARQEPPQPSGPATSAPAAVPDEYQLECALVTAAKPRPGVQYEITLPDGQDKTGASGSDGVIRISGLTVTGNATLVLPAIDARIPEGWSSRDGIPYARGGVTIPVGTSKVALPPAVYRGRMTGMLFETDKSFLLPSAMPGIKELKLFYDEHPGLEVMVSGHADRAGTASYNLTLSVERAEAIEAFLQDQVGRWTPWYRADKPASKRWGVREDQYMLFALGHYAGPIHGRKDAATKNAVSDFRAANDLGAGDVDDAMRSKLIEKYMQTDGTTLPAGTPIQHHGCGEHHPEIETPDGVAEPENRRVELFFFEGPVDPPSPGPCPSGGCTQYPEWRKRVIETIDVNAAPEVTFTLLDELGLPLKNTSVKITYPDGRARPATTDDKGTFLARVKPEDSLDVEIVNCHEAALGDGITTASGTHFPAGGPP
jgi:outer membrane protein OmpA-like peptidoglycan-associated protein/phage baseplate assembly protein gpV